MSEPAAIDEFAKFVIRTVLGVAIMRAAADHKPARARRGRRGGQPDGSSLPGGKGHSFGQRMGKRRTLS